MSGQPVKTQADKNKKRNEYLESLALQEQINDMNLQANKNYLLTGQLPPQSQMQDNRTTTEKLKDIELMKQKIVGDFAGTISAQAVHALIQKIIDSPLNLNNSLFRFFAQRATSIAEQFKKQYSVGIEGDANDIERIFEYVKSMYSDTQGKFQTTKSYMNSMSSGSSSSRIIGGNDLDVVINQLEDLIKNIQFTTQRGVNIGGIPNTSQTLRILMGKILELKQTMPNTNEMSILMNEFNNPVGNIDTERRKIYEAYFTLIEKLPKYNEVSSLITKINQYIASNNLETASDGIKRLKNMFSILYNRENNRIMQEFYNSYKQPLDVILNEERKLGEIQRINDIENMDREERLKSKAQKVYIVNPENDPVWVRNPTNIGNIPNDNFSQTPSETEDSVLYHMRQNIIDTKNEIRHIGNIINSGNFDENDILEAISIIRFAERITHNPPARITEDTTPDVILIILDRLYNDLKIMIDDNTSVELSRGSSGYNPDSDTLSELSSVGNGLKRGRGRPQGYRKMKGGCLSDGSETHQRHIQPKEDLRKKANFVGFGINEIHQKQLDKGLVKIRRSTKSNYMDMPTRRVSTNLQGILKTIVGGGVPNYNDLGKLDEEEKIYLNKLISRSELTDRISVPAPSKDQQEKDIHNFEVMRGQILSGNDSQELVKQFKVLIRKLMRQGLLPKADVEDLLTTLIDLGY